MGEGQCSGGTVSEGERANVPTRMFWRETEREFQQEHFGGRGNIPTGTFRRATGNVPPGTLRRRRRRGNAPVGTFRRANGNLAARTFVFF